ncbi:hypothetical protein ACQVTX_23100 [Bacillus pretiosus]|uniref:hypothetical protein n=1 Tax=Bacillus pretiosus TaxID=2983392 RepID=UPI003D654050
MATSFTSIYQKFLGMVDDYELGLVSDEELSEVLFGYLDQARSLYFPQCKKDLSKITENLGLGEFKEDLTSQEEFILAMCMKKAWVSTKLNNADLMRKATGDRDFKAQQGTNYLRELSKLDAKIDDEIRRYAVSYTYNNFSLEGW